MDKIKLIAEERKTFGRKVKKLRSEGKLPANVFGKAVKSQALEMKLTDFVTTFKKAGETGLFYLQIKAGKKEEEKPVLIANIQNHPVSGLPIHVDFHQVDLKEKVTAEVAVEIFGVSPAEKGGIGTVVQYINKVEVEALPTDLPEKFAIDISKLEEVDQAIFVKDLPVDKAKVEIKGDLEAILVKVEPPQKEEVVAPPVAETPVEGETPAEAEAKPGEEAPAEGQASKEEAPATPKE